MNTIDTVPGLQCSTLLCCTLLEVLSIYASRLHRKFFLHTHFSFCLCSCLSLCSCFLLSLCLYQSESESVQSLAIPLQAWCVPRLPEALHLVLHYKYKYNGKTASGDGTKVCPE